MAPGTTMRDASSRRISWARSLNLSTAALIASGNFENASFRESASMGDWTGIGPSWEMMVVSAMYVWGGKDQGCRRPGSAAVCESSRGACR